MKNGETLHRSLKLTRKDGLKEMLAVFFIAVLSRLFILAAGFVMLKLFGNGRTFNDIFPTAGDVPHYLYIAEHWYTNVGEKANLIVFYPFFPALIAAFRVVFRSYILSGLIISYLSFGIASCYFYKLLKLDYNDEKTAYGMAGMFMALFGVFFLSAHSESLFIALVAMGLYYIREKKWLAVGIIGFLAALTKTQGVLLFMPAVYEIAVDAFKKKRFDKKTLFTLLVPFGYVCYLLLNLIYFGNPMKFLEFEEAAPWYNTSKWIADSIATSYATGSGYFALSLIMYWPQIILFFAAVASIFVGLRKKVRTSYLVFIGTYTAMTYMQGWMLSGGRYISSCIPIYIVFASIDNKYVKNILLMFTGIFYIILSYLWMAGHAIM